MPQTLKHYNNDARVWHKWITIQFKPSTKFVYLAFVLNITEKTYYSHSLFKIRKKILSNLRKRQKKICKGNPIKEI